MEQISQGAAWFNPEFPPSHPSYGKGERKLVRRVTSRRLADAHQDLAWCWRSRSSLMGALKWNGCRAPDARCDFLDDGSQSASVEAEVLFFISLDVEEYRMSEETKTLEGPDLVKGIALSDLASGSMLLGHAHGEPVLLARRDDELFAIGAVCTHYAGPLAAGLLVDDTVRCPWHHACFSLRTGEAIRAPALNPVPRWRVERRDGMAYVREKLAARQPVTRAVTEAPRAVIILGGGAAGNAAAEMLRREGYSGHISMLSADDFVPCDRPNLSKDYLAGSAQEEWVPLRSPQFYKEHDIDLTRQARRSTRRAAPANTPR